uniref:F-box domain-containing protein n=2 Tax=Oryza brachyantha TaxID=4533 RepID=J3N0S5_ORYBR
MAPLLLAALPQELMVDILLRLDDMADLARASSACKALRRLVVSGPFLRRLHALHPRPVLGLLDLSGDVSRSGFIPAEPPHPSAATAAAVARGSDFAFSFLPGGPAGWRFRDFRHGLALFSSYSVVADCGCFHRLVVCDPLRRRYVLIPPIDEDLAAPIRDLRRAAVRDSDYLVSPAGREGLSFRVICRPKVPEECDVTVFIFFSGAVVWRAATLAASRATTQLSSPQFVHCYIYWRTPLRDRLLMLDTREMDFFFLRFEPRDVHLQAIGETDEIGRIAVFNMDYHQHGRVELLSKEIRGGADARWRHDRTAQLLPGYKWRIVRLAEGYLLLQGVLCGGPSRFTLGTQLHYFTLEIKTFKLERLCTPQFQGCIHHPKFYADRLCLYRSFPPPLSLSSI